MTTYGFDGVDIDLENGVNPTYMAQALRSLSGKVGRNLIITMAPQTIDMQSHRTALLPARAVHQGHPDDRQHPVLQLRLDARLRPEPGVRRRAPRTS